MTKGRATNTPATLLRAARGLGECTGLRHCSTSSSTPRNTSVAPTATGLRQPMKMTNVARKYAEKCSTAQYPVRISSTRCGKKSEAKTSVATVSSAHEAPIDAEAAHRRANRPPPYIDLSH